MTWPENPFQNNWNLITHSAQKFSHASGFRIGIHSFIPLEECEWRTYALQKVQIHNYAAQSLEWQPCKTWNPKQTKKKNRKNKKLRQSQPGVVIGLESWSSRVESRSPSSRPRSTLEHQPSRLVEVSRRRTPPVSRWRCQGLKGRQGKVRLAWEPVINEPWTREFFQPFLNLCASEGKQNLNAKK